MALALFSGDISRLALVTISLWEMPSKCLINLYANNCGIKKLVRKYYLFSLCPERLFKFIEGHKT
jgi:hypothetical protein